MGSVSAETTDPAMEDIKLIMEGGPNFVKRMTALQEAKKSQEEAYKNLKIGTDAKQAYDDANAKQAQSVKDLEEARARATAIVRDAEHQRAAILETAEKVKTEAQTHASKVSHEAEGAANDMKTQAAAKLAEAQKERDSVSHDRAKLEAAQAEFAKKAVEADVKVKAAEDMRAAFAKKLKALEQAVEAAAK